MNPKDQRVALYGWGAGALVAIGAYVGAMQFYPAEPSAPLLATIQASDLGVDPIMTGSIGNAASQPMPDLPMPLQARLDSITMELAALRDALAAAQASTVSTNRRLTDMEQNLTFMTASISQPAGDASDQALPAAIGTMNAEAPEPRVILPSPTPVDGGAIAVSMRPLTVSTEADATMPMEESNPPAEEAAAGDLMAPTSEQPILAVSQTPFAIDIGGATTLEGIDALWMNHAERYAETLAELTPRILLQQTSNGALDLRLVAGPINDAADAAMLCAQLVAAGLERCLPAIFDGQQLALR
ncbi:MAG: SPOR domain-containing protein [Rhizobiales bacterium]|nr:SPOR domain-containing protein [Hyphomicrobiales bacterium]MBO6698367.1 SPOR domain-containing protein [Hyphomicrobiales bacterium]MBO6735379.1 SPOR domain-containing protein [Hyphomicrobiales bacterium]MBO6910813.1 SPOR domain-containing protein [Hyphomicrobiales bacterium]MBO6957251.1 SPOR domain-containing protein [Hyphomicrobiales bacterium]